MVNCLNHRPQKNPIINNIYITMIGTHHDEPVAASVKKQSDISENDSYWSKFCK